jgi:hypothetical protein
MAAWLGGFARIPEDCDKEAFFTNAFAQSA